MKDYAKVKTLVRADRQGSSGSWRKRRSLPMPAKWTRGKGRQQFAKEAQTYRPNIPWQYLPPKPPTRPLTIELTEALIAQNPKSEADRYGYGAIPGCAGETGRGEG